MERTLFDIEDFVRRHVTHRAESLLKEDFARHADALHAAIDGRRILVIGGAGSIGSQYVKAALRDFAPAVVHVIDTDENALTELTRDLRSGGGPEVKDEGEGERRSVCRVPKDYLTEPIDFGSKIFGKFLRARGPYDIVANFAAHKHVRAERDVFSIEAMCETNVFAAKRLLDQLLEMPPERFFCVSTDKAANPVNVMGATKKLMEDTVLAYAARLPVRMARFANVAFSNGSLPLGWLNRLAKRQPISCPTGIRRFFVSPVESGELCLFASVMGADGDIFYPKLDPARDLVSFESFLPAFLRACGCADWPCALFPSDTDGEKPIEEFFTAADVRDESSFAQLGVIRNAAPRALADVEAALAVLRATFNRPDATKDDLIAVLEDHLPTFRHRATGKSLDDRM